MQEWNDKYNSFNSDIKGATYYEQYLSIAEWKEGKRKAPLPPVEISMDIASICQLKCRHCNFGKYFENEREMRIMPREHIFDLLKFLSDWKNKTLGICWGGGGESTLNPAIADSLFLSKQLGLENSIATNGINFDDKLIEISAMTCRWIGVSIDAATEKTYNTNRRGNYFNIAIKNIEKLVKEVNKNRYNNDIGFKYLLFDYNQHEIFEACKLAKSLGVRDFHIRPADFSHQGVKDKISNPYNIELIEEEFSKCHTIEDDNFRVFTIVHKFNKDFTPKKKFSQCYASPLCLQITPEGNLFLCPDTRNIEFYKLG